MMILYFIKRQNYISYVTIIRKIKTIIKISTYIYLKSMSLQYTELKNQPIYKGVHKTLCINFRACTAFCHKIMSSGQE